METKTKRYYSEEFRASAIQFWRNNQETKVSLLAKELNISPSCLHSWIAPVRRQLQKEAMKVVLDRTTQQSITPELNMALANAKIVQLEKTIQHLTKALNQLLGANNE